MNQPATRVARTDIPADAWLVDAHDAARRAGVAVGTIWSWHSRGKIHAVGYVAGRAMYNLADVMTTERQTRQTRRGAPRKPGIVDTPAGQMQGSPQVGQPCP